MSLHQASKLAVVAGVLAHNYYFRQGEHHLYPFRYVQFHGLLLLVGVALLHFVCGLSVRSSLGQVSRVCLYYLGGLYGSLIIYRGVFHRLCRFPGPIGARISALWMSLQLRKKPAFRMLQDLHARYGPIVRVGPSDLSVSDPEAVHLIYGNSSRCNKSDFYDMSYPAQSLLSFRSRTQHDKRRRVWSTAFGDKALRGYEDRIRAYRQKLFDKLALLEGQPVNMNEWFTFYAYDVMGDLAFGRSFDMLENKRDHWAIQVLMAGIAPLEYLIPVWFLRLFLGLTYFSKDWWRFGEFSNQRLVHRMKNKPSIPDISASLLASVDCDNPTPEDMAALGADTRLIITAGSDTSAIALTMAVFELANHPDEVKKLRDELVPYTPDTNGEYQHERIGLLPHLNGLINETLRLHPPIPSIIPRKSPPEGVDLHGIMIPGHVNVYCPQWVIGRSSAAYECPEAFIPERWYKQPELIKDKSAFAPFTIGPYACIGKSLALMNLRTTIARLIMTYDIHFPPGVDASSFLEDAREHFSLSLGEMNVVLSRYRP